MRITIECETLNETAKGEEKQTYKINVKCESFFNNSTKHNGNENSPQIRMFFFLVSLLFFVDEKLLTIRGWEKGAIELKRFKREKEQKHSLNERHFKITSSDAYALIRQPRFYAFVSFIFNTKIGEMKTLEFVCQIVRQRKKVSQ